MKSPFENPYSQEIRSGGELGDLYAPERPSDLGIVTSVSDVVGGQKITWRELTTTGSNDATLISADNASFDTAMVPATLGVVGVGDIVRIATIYQRDENVAVPTQGSWFPVRITDKLSASSYAFVEVWLNNSGLVEDRVGGQTNSATDPAYAIDGSTFTVAAAGSAVVALARRAMGAGGTKWELKGGGSSIYSGVTAGAVASGASGNVTVSGVGTVSVYNQWSTTIATAKKCLIGWVANESRYQFIAIDC